ncbi:MAG: phage tail sheath family protein [Granulosicoccus sp.]
MPPTLTVPGVFVEELHNRVPAIEGTATSITALVGRALRGPVNSPTLIRSYSEFLRTFGELWQPATLGYAVNQFFQNGGREALIVRVFNGNIADSTATITLETDDDDLILVASSPGSWGRNLQVTVDHSTSNPADAKLFNLVVAELDTAIDGAVRIEQFHALSSEPTHPRFVTSVLNEESALVTVRAGDFGTPADGTVNAVSIARGDGNAITDADIVGNQHERSGIYALEHAERFNLLCIPPPTRSTDVTGATWAKAATYCKECRAMLLIDAPSAWSANPRTLVSDAIDSMNALLSTIGIEAAENAALYYPRLRVPDPLSQNRLADFAPCGAVAGIFARTDIQRGVWKAPAGRDASLTGVAELSINLTSSQNSKLNASGINCLRSFPQRGHVVWGARTLSGAVRNTSEWKYVPVRRLALYLEESLTRGLQWVAFESNDEHLWSTIRSSTDAFMQTLFRQGAFQGRSVNDAWFIRCGNETTTRADINRGVVNVVVGFAPVKPAEFVIIRILQMTISPGSVNPGQRVSRDHDVERHNGV